MKRISNIFQKIYDRANIELADDKARKCKRKRYGVRKHDERRAEDNDWLQTLLENGWYQTSKYTTFKIYEPKEREIFRLPYYPDRITHHAIMNILEPIWKKIFTKNTYSCIKGRGIHALVKDLQSDLKNDIEGTTYCLKMDIHKFYPSITHSILKDIIKKKIKDKRLLGLLFEIIDSADGVPIGNYLSQYFANLYLAYFDHWVKEELKVKYYYRYADDIVLLGDSKDKLRSWLLAIKIYLTNVLNLSLKENYQIFPVESRGIDYVGYVFRHGYTKLRKKMKQKIFKDIEAYKKGEISSEKLQKTLTAYFGWLKCCNSKNLLKKIYKETGIHYAGWNGARVKRQRFRKKYVHIVSMQFYKKYYLVQFVRNHKSYEIKTRDGGLYMRLNSTDYMFPTNLKL